MQRDDVNRRQFHQWTLAALGGMASGALAGCSKKTGVGPETGRNDVPTTGDGASATGESLLLQEPHVCRGLNLCQGQGASKENSCAGQGTCASVAQHDCSGQNECKGQGGCGANPGENSCKGQGGCHVPLMEHAWGTARKNFELAAKSINKEIGAAPAAM